MRRSSQLQSSASNRTNIKLIIGIFSISIVLGMTWVFGAILLHDVVRYLFVIFNAFQGFLFFIFTVIIGTEGRAFWLTTLRLKKQKRTVYTTSGKYSSSAQYSKNSTSRSYLTSGRKTNGGSYTDSTSEKEKAFDSSGELEKTILKNENFEMSDNSNGETLQPQNGSSAHAVTSFPEQSVVVDIDS